MKPDVIVLDLRRVTIRLAPVASPTRVLIVDDSANTIEIDRADLVLAPEIKHLRYHEVRRLLDDGDDRRHAARSLVDPRLRKRRSR